PTGLPAWGWALIGIAIAAVLAGVAVAVFFGLKSTKKNADVQSDDAENSEQSEESNEDNQE
ncbi:MAG: hypothetical protein K2N74_05875, partial [Clostridiales bacterium]|nr:hypothetical protein [Clostridiales bacterium]